MSQQPGTPTPVLDDVSLSIIEQLREDGRRSYAAIATAVGLSEAAVRQRVQRLRDRGLVKIVAVTDPSHLGLTRQAMVGIRARGPLDPVADLIAEMPESESVVVTAGSVDLLVEVVCHSDAHLVEVLGRIRDIEAVVATETFVYLQLRKQSYAWGSH
ncbi:Lrp/AsnC family transcriptional regulator [Ornithinimicrobium sediminis]|uniref:Lrp/AsnC family transcriptional regulator n=1 Tax=Ornithinimicrobium sediminis TaxID=2904603 RepID=UPI001E61D9CA|nr:Lrp/AsnC family transcriptional regulator [Ornithinimicrobium sediminis]